MVAELAKSFGAAAKPPVAESLRGFRYVIDWIEGPRSGTRQEFRRGGGAAGVPKALAASAT